MKLPLSERCRHQFELAPCFSRETPGYDNVAILEGSVFELAPCFSEEDTQRGTGSTQRNSIRYAGPRASSH
jgi:hypothetical protein